MNGWTFTQNPHKWGKRHHTHTHTQSHHKDIFLVLQLYVTVLRNMVGKWSGSLFCLFSWIPSVVLRGLNKTWIASHVVSHLVLNSKSPLNNETFLYLHLPLNREGCLGTTDDFITSFLQFSQFSTALWDLANSRPVHSLILPSHLSFCPPCLEWNGSHQIKSLTHCWWHRPLYVWRGWKEIKMNEPERQKLERQDSCQ